MEVDTSYGHIMDMLAMARDCKPINSRPQDGFDAAYAITIRKVISELEKNPEGASADRRSIILSRFCYDAALILMGYYEDPTQRPS